VNLLRGRNLQLGQWRCFFLHAIAVMAVKVWWS